MTAEEIVASWYESQFNLIDEKAASDLIAKIKSALTSRTEQCAKICESYWDHGPALTLHQDRIAGKVADRMAAKIRALNQSLPTEEKKS